MKLSTMQAWLSHIGEIHPQTIVLGLDRVKAVAQRLNVLTPGVPVILVGGTNGKGSTIEALSRIYQAAGYRTGSFTSPYLLKHNEEVRVNGVPASDASFCAAFEAITKVKGEVVLTPFEYHTLAALFILKQAAPDIYLLEIGMGGRLDAVNIMEPSVSVITSIALDHMAFLGETREAIAIEKAGIMRADKPVVIAEPEPPESLAACVKAAGAKADWVNHDYQYEVGEKTWSFYSDTMEGCETYQRGSLHPSNLAAAIQAVQCLQPVLAVAKAAIRQGVEEAALPGRQQKIPGAVTHWLDVSHNPHAMRLLCERLKADKPHGKTIAVFGMLADKDIKTSLERMKAVVDHWYAAPLSHPRAASLEDLQKAFHETGMSQVNFQKTVDEAYAAARSSASAGDRIVIMGSFVLVAALMERVQP